MTSDKEGESKLQQLIEIGKSHNAEGIKDSKNHGGKVVGLWGCYIPEEILYAADILPWHLIGSMKESTPLAGVHRSPATDAYNNHLLEALLDGELDFLDGWIVTNYDDDTKSMEYFARYYGKPPIPFWLEIPVAASELNLQRFTENLTSLKVEIEDRIGTKITTQITTEQLRDAIKEYNTSRKLLRQLYEMRKKDKPPLKGSEIWAIVSAAMSMPQREFIKQLEPLIPYIEQRQPDYPDDQNRILLSTDFLHTIDYIKIIEDAGGTVAMDDMDTGVRYFWDIVDEEGDPLRALAERYLGPMNSPRSVNWDRQIDQIVEWTKEYKIDGVIQMPVIQALPRLFRSEFFDRTMGEEDIPFLDIQREYHLANVAQITTRVEAFLEMLSQRK